MATRAPYVPAGGDTPTAAQWRDGAVGWYGYKQATADQTGITTETDLTDLASLSVTIGASGRQVKVSAHCTVDADTASDAVTLRLYQDADIKATCRRTLGAAGRDETMSIMWTGTPSSGAHTYKLTLTLAAGTGPVNLRASSSDVATLLVEDLGTQA